MMSMVNRKTFALISFLLAAFAIFAAGCGKDESETGSGENKEKTYKIGISVFANHPSLNAATQGFKKALADKGLKVEFDEQNASADVNNAKIIAQNLVNAKADLIFANATPSAQAAVSEAQAAGIPVVFTSVTDPVGAELVESLENPGKNATGTTDYHPEAIPKTVQFIAENFPGKRVGTIYNAGEQNSVKQIEAVKAAMKDTDLKLVEKVVSNSSEIKQAAEALAGEADVFYIITDNTVVNGLEAVIGAAEDHDIPLFVGELDSVKRGGFAAYGFDYYDIGYEAGQLAYSILKEGKKASELPVRYPQNLKLAINAKAAKEMGVEIKPEWKNIAEILE